MKTQITAVITPAAAMIRISAGARTIPGIPLKRSPLPNL